MEKILENIANWIHNKNERIIIGISGHGASGKTTFANNLISRLAKEEVNYIDTDAYIIGSNLRKHTKIAYEYEDKKYLYKMTACHPDAHNLSALERDIKMIKEGLNLYSIETHFSKSTLISSRKINILDGMTVAFINPNFFDLKIYMHTDGETELIRRSIRDVSERNTDINYLNQSHEHRRIQYQLFMHAYRQNFDVVVRNSNQETFLEKGRSFLDVSLSGIG